MVEGGPGAAIITVALRIDKLLPEPASGDLAEMGASSAAIEPVEVDTAIEGAPKDIVKEAIMSGVMTIRTSAPLGNAIVTYKQPLLAFFFAYLCPNKILLQVFHLWPHQLRRSWRAFLERLGRRQRPRLL